MLKSQKARKENPEFDPMRLGTGWIPEELSQPQILLESTFGDSHPGSTHLNALVDSAGLGVYKKMPSQRSILPPISATVWPADTRASDTHWPHGILSHHW